MKTQSLLIFLSAAMLFVLAAPESKAQEIVINGDFETLDFSQWTLIGGNANTLVSQFWFNGQLCKCMKRRPGTPNNNGGITQDLHLIGGVTYIFYADIAAMETG